MTLTVYHPGIAVPPSFELFDSTTAITTITKGEQVMKLMDEDVVNLEIMSSVMLPFQIGDFITVYEKIYKLHNMPTVSKTAAKRFKYTVVFEGLQYDLINTTFLLGKDTMLDSLSADIDTFLALIVSNLDRVYPGLYAVGTTPASSAIKNLTFSDCNCLEALQKICEEYKTEFDITTVTGVNYINIRVKEVFFTTPFSIGKSGGLYEITRELSDTYPYITRMFAYGSSENLGNSYRHSRLCLPTKTKDTSYLQSTILGVPIKEGIKVYDDIKPERTGSVTTKVDELTFIDDNMTFDLSERWKKRGVLYYIDDSWHYDYQDWLYKKGLTDNLENQTIYDNDVYGTTKYLIGTETRIHFQTGQLAGYEFQLSGYEHTTKKFALKRFTDENGNKFPHPNNTAFQFQPGDKYIILNISMPDVYIDDAELRLNTAAAADFAVTEKPLFKYAIDISPLCIKTLRAAASGAINLFTVGDYAKIVDADFDVNAYFRIIEYKRSILNINDIDIVLSDKRGFNMWEQTAQDVRENKRALELNKMFDVFKSIADFKTSTAVLQAVFNQSNLIDGVKIEVKETGSATINNELYSDVNNFVKILKIQKTIGTDKESLEIKLTEPEAISAYISPNIAKENEITAQVSENLTIINTVQSYDSNENLVYTFSIQGTGTSETETLTLTSSTDSSITIIIPVTVIN
jgi:hypothetical protein